MVNDIVETNNTELAKDQWIPDLPKINQRQQARLHYYTNPENKDTYDNATKSYLKAYMQDRYTDIDKVLSENPKLYEQANREVYKLKRTENIQARLDYILDLQGYNDYRVDREHLKLINQDSDKSTKLNAIKHYDKKKGRIKENTGSWNIQINQIFAQVMQSKDNIVGKQ